MRIEGAWVDRVTGLDGVQLDMVSVSAPDDGSWLELTKFRQPAERAAAQPPAPNRPGFRHIACVVDDLDGVVQRLRANGFDTVGDIVNHEGVFRLCYVGGPEGLLVELAERVDSVS
ncbi:MAG TPA: VOC family protein [Trebonia sp.]|jgi:catechol 2,3-dioxygenase-like lactoylglutathione lyase family enzyme|nr:VOC family protein [Trebonia sp.]